MHSNIQYTKIDIFDLDGTLTYTHGDIEDTSGYPSYAYWVLINFHFVKDSLILQKMIMEWEELMKSEKDPAGCSHVMMQKALEIFHDGINGQDVYLFSKEVTHRFVQHNIVRKEAIAHLKNRIQKNVLCIISTGSYEESALGFVDALVEAGWLTEKDKQFLRVSGGIIDWKKRKVMHANVCDNKLIGIANVLDLHIDDIKPHVENVYGDDPEINDKDILALAPQGSAHVIATIKNKDKLLPNGYKHKTWGEIIYRK